MKTIAIATIKSAEYATHAGKVKPVYRISFADKLDDEQKKFVREHGVFSSHGHWYIGVKNPNVDLIKGLVQKPKASKKQAPKAQPKAEKPDFSKMTKAQLIAYINAH